MISPSDLVGCRYRSVQRSAHPDVPPTPAGLARLERIEKARAVVFESLPVTPARGDRGYFARVDAGDDFFDTLEAIAAGATLITNAVLNDVSIDILVAFNGGYLPVIITNHRAARPHAGRRVSYLAVPRLGLGSPLTGEYKIRHHAIDTYRLAIAGRALQEMDLERGYGGVIGQDRTRAFLDPLPPLYDALDRALLVETPTAPRRVKECDSCRYWPYCSEQLTASDDISLLLPGDRANPYREMGLTTVSALAAANLGDASRMAVAFQNGEVVVPRGPVTAPRFDVELDIDLESYLDQGVYLWGAFDGSTYHAFTAWSLSTESEAFAAFWDFISGVRDDALEQGLTFGAFCYSNHGENHWLRSAARRFAGQPGVPSLEEVEDFIGAPYWIDIFQLVRKQFLGPFGLGLKVIAPAAGYNYHVDVDGESSVNLYLAAASGATDAREELLQYNEDDCRATAAVREWLAGFGNAN
ncbi:TM0106 family RecB-like putative nuclease [Corynebacterium hindlerae]|uniref:TM0106 family RecB-like putative nuclease n=1 Tax=Corynebacterium hindlerae TaxID=699041 RepID=A0A7G5FCL9_9CORY|nr:TM0106 family RecB-like putative nuclease [Corynebacterium hindlerae]QMV84360.1 TM0106 family RecB-like putative nuclease [Corynebacterium hindlerae]